jgi:hypothetical protein
MTHTFSKGLQWDPAWQYQFFVHFLAQLADILCKDPA